VSFARTHHLLPEAYLYGIAYVRKHEIDRPAFLDNQWSIVGFRSFFPLAFLYKTPLPFLFLLALAVYAAIANRHSWKVENDFNPIAGGPSRGSEHLVDSSLDWGQDLPALKTWIDNHRAIVDRKPVYLAYFGTADPRAYEINAELILPDTQLAPTPSGLTRGIYCVSATTLQSVYADDE